MSEEISHRGWFLSSQPVQDADGFDKIAYHAVHQETGRRVYLHCSPHPRNFTPTYDRFRYLVDEGFPKNPRGNWFDADLDRMIENKRKGGVLGAVRRIVKAEPEGRNFRISLECGHQRLVYQARTWAYCLTCGDENNGDGNSDEQEDTLRDRLG